MRKILCFLLFFALLFSAFSCDNATPDARMIMKNLKYVAKIDGHIYSSAADEGEEGYIDGDLENMLFFGEAAPQCYALILSPFIDYHHEVLLIIPTPYEDSDRLFDLARRRLCLILQDSDAQPEYGAEFIVYSTLPQDLDIRREVEKIISAT